MPKKPVTLKDLAAAAGLSPASISMILNRRSLSRFNQNTVEKVFALAGETGYVGCRGRTFFLPKLRERLILVVCPSLANPFYTSLIQGIEMAAHKAGYVTSLRTTYWDPEAEDAIIEQAQKFQAAGIIFTMLPQQAESAYELSRQIPVVTIGDRQDGWDLTTVDMNNFVAGQILARHLLELGHRQVAYLSTTLDKHAPRLRRLQGLKTALALGGAECTVLTKEIQPDYELAHTDTEFTSGFELANECLDQYPHITALVGINDMLAYGAYDAALNRGLSVPEDISVCGFDNILPSRLRSVGLTTVDNSLIECGKSSFTLLKEEIDSYKQRGSFDSITHVEYKCRLVMRTSTGPARKSPEPC